jgi:hypothetical protein
MMTFEEVARYTELTEAQTARSALESAGLSVSLRDEQTGSLNWLYLPALGGLRLEVRADQVAAAREILTLDLADREGSAPVTPHRGKRLAGWVALAILLLPYLVSLLF